jgi:RNA polymerase sigma-70 factor, ECF subfamily
VTEPYSFETLLGQAKIGNERAMVVLYRNVQPAVIRYLRARETSVAEDLASEVWIGVLAGLGTFEGDEMAFRSWVFTIAHRRVADHRRKAGRRRTDPSPDEVLDRAGPDAGSDRVDELAAQEAVQALIAGLPPDQAEVILLRVIADLPVAEVAAITGKNEGHVRVLQHRALQRLARQLASDQVTERHERVTR